MVLTLIAISAVPVAVVTACILGFARETRRRDDANMRYIGCMLQQLKEDLERDHQRANRYMQDIRSHQKN